MLIKDCDYQNIADSLLRDHIIKKTRDPRFAETLRANRNWTMAQIDEEGKNSDARLQEQAASEAAQVPAVDAVVKKNHHRGHRGSFRGHYGPPHPRGAYRRGGRGHWNGGWGDFEEVPFDCTRCDTRHRPRRCPAYGVECNKCGTLGHFEKCL